MVAIAFERGQSGIVAVVPPAEPVVGHWRARFDASAASGLPAHVTALFPFLPGPMLSNAVMARLAAVCAATPPLDLLFRHCARFPGVLYLEPEPATGLAALTQKILIEWPEVSPYGGVYDDVVPHLTVALGVDEAMMDEIEADISRRLPFNARVTEAALFIFDGARWRQQASLPLAAVS